jgi:ribosome-binding factor A
VYARSERLIELFRQEVSLLLPTVKDPGLSGFVTVTGLELSRDMKTATVYYSILGSKAERESTGQALNRAAGYIRHELRGKLHLKMIPEIKFRYDDTPERASKVERIFQKIEQENQPHADAHAPTQERPPRKDRRGDKKE